MSAQHLNSPQMPRNRRVAYSGLLVLPDIEPLSPLVVKSKALEIQLRGATPTSRESLDRFCTAWPAGGWDDSNAYPDLHDELEPYLPDGGPRDDHAETTKASTEFAVYRALAGRHPPFATMDEAAFTRCLLDLHRRLGTGLNSLRSQPVALRPDAAGNRVLFPDHRLCPLLLASLHRFIAGHLADYPALCATVAFAAIVHAHPFDDGNGRTARLIYNLILAEAIPTRHFLPVGILAVRRPAFAIRLKRALHGGDWLSLQAFFVDAARLSRKLQAEEAPALEAERV